jgi:hypothetical protein
MPRDTLVLPADWAAGGARAAGPEPDPLAMLCATGMLFAAGRAGGIPAGAKGRWRALVRNRTR